MQHEFIHWANLATMFFVQAARMGDRNFLWEKKDGIYAPLSWRQTAERAEAVARGLLDQDIKPGDRVALVSENRPDWLIIDMAIMSIGAITVPAYTTNTRDDHCHILCDSGARAVFVSTQRLAKILLPAVADSPSTTLVISMDGEMDADVAGNITTLSLQTLIDNGKNRTEDIAAMSIGWERERTACINYTSGTGGLPKGVMLHHGAILHNCTAAEDALREIGLGDDIFLSFLPLSHSYEHMAGQFFPVSIGAQIYYAEGIEALGSNMVETRPTIMTAVPRLYETMHRRITRGVQKQGGLKAMMFNAAYALGAKRYQSPASLTPLDRVVDRVVDKLVRDKVRDRFGGRLKALVSGGAPLNPEIGLFFTALGLRILQGYGQTESAPLISVNRATNTKMHTVGPIVRDTEVRIAEDGEILCRGELVMQGYWNNDEATRDAIVDGWLHTGDIGGFDEDGQLMITDRKKDIIVNSGGDNLAPQRVEGALTVVPEIGQAMVYGDRHPHLVALIVPDEGWLAEWKRETGKRGSLADLREDEELRAAIGAAIDRVNGALSNIEKVRRFILASEAFLIENGEMTPTMKVKRHVLKTRYGERLEALYR